jgi:hypothetical protein
MIAAIIQRGNRARFVLEALPRFRIRRERAGEHLDGARAIEPDVAGAVDLSHAAPTERGEDLEVSDGRTGRKAHELGSGRRL